MRLWFIQSFDEDLSHGLRDTAKVPPVVPTWANLAWSERPGPRIYWWCALEQHVRPFRIPLAVY